MMLSGEAIARTLGTLWGIVPLSYWLTGSANPAYVAILAAYAIAIGLGAVRSVPHVAFEVVAVIGIFLALSVVVEVDEVINIPSYVGIGLFVVNLTLLLSIIQPKQTLVFLRVFFEVTAACAVLHVFLVLGGKVGDNYGRYLFLGDMHPNLGGEIYAVAGFAGAISSGRKATLIYTHIPQVRR